MKEIKPIKIGSRKIGKGYPCYIIAEIGSNFDGSLKKAKKLTDDELANINIQVEGTQRDLATLKLGGNRADITAKTQELKDLIKEQVGLKKIQQRMAAQVMVLEKMGKESVLKVSIDDLQRFWDKLTPEFGWRTKNRTKVQCRWVLVIVACGWGRSDK